MGKSATAMVYVLKFTFRILSIRGGKNIGELAGNVKQLQEIRLNEDLLLKI
jgi:hypothetical protein